MKKALIVVDMQNDFVSGTLGTKEAQAVVEQMKAYLQTARSAGAEVIFTRDTHGAEYLTTQEGKNLPVPHCIKDTTGWEIVDGLYQTGERIFDKPVFGSVELASFVKSADYDEVELIGVCTDICVVSNALLIKAYTPEMAVSVNAALCAGVTPEKHFAALETLRSCQVRVF